MIRLVSRLSWLAVAWVALWGDISLANVIAGLALATLLVAGFPPPTAPEPVRFHPLAAARFVLHFARKLVEASAIVAWEVVTPRNRINEGIVAVPLDTSSTTVVTLVANAISLTPGTLTLEVTDHPTVLYVHVLHLHDIASVRRDVRRLETLALGAFARTDGPRVGSGSTA